MKDIKTVIIDRIIEEVEIQIKNAERGRLDAIEESKAHKGAMASRSKVDCLSRQYLSFN